MYHYLHMAKGNYREYLQGDRVKIKKYFYVLRPVLACQWIEKHNTMPPVEFDRLVEELIPQGSGLQEAVSRLLVRKRAGEELDYEPKIGPISDFLETNIAYYEKTAPGMGTSGEKQDQLLDTLFRSTLAEVWGWKSPAGAAANQL
jgi:predicted nucleotidyltransferase